MKFNINRLYFRINIILCDQNIVFRYNISTQPYNIVYIIKIWM